MPRQKLSTCRIIALCILLANTTARAVIVKPVDPNESPEVAYRWPIVTAPLMAKAPVVDGTIDRAEWSAAAQLAPLVALDGGAATDELTTLFIGYTQDAIHVAFQFGRPANALEPVSGADPMNVWRDDCIEFFLRPAFGEKWEYSFVGNAAGVCEEGRRRGNTDKGWKCDWKYGARRTDWGWEGEMTIPFASLGLETPNPGTSWEMAPVRNQKTPRQELACWSYLKHWNASEDFGYLVFGADAPAVRVLHAGELSRIEVGALFEFSNFGQQNRNLIVRCELLQPKVPTSAYFGVVESAANPLGPQAEVKEQILAKKVAEEALKQFNRLAKIMQEVSVPANQSRRLSFTLPSARGKYVLIYSVADAETKKILAAGPLPFFRRDPIEITVTPYLLSQGAIEAMVDYRKAPGIAENDLVQVRVLDDQGKAVTEPIQQTANTQA